MSDLARRFLSSLFIISHPLSFVKRFFKTFLSFFLDRFAFAWLCLSDSFIISHPVPFVKRFFKTFFKFFFEPLAFGPSVQPSP